MNHDKDASGSTWKEWITNNPVPTCVHALWVLYSSNSGEMKSGHIYRPNPSACNCFSSGKDFLNCLNITKSKFTWLGPFFSHTLRSSFKGNLQNRKYTWRWSLSFAGLHRRRTCIYSICYLYAQWSCGRILFCIYGKCLTGNTMSISH